MLSSLIFYIYIRVLHFLVFSVRFLSIKELSLLVFGCSIFGFLDKKLSLLVSECYLFVFSYKVVIFISFKCYLFVFFF